MLRENKRHMSKLHRAWEEISERPDTPEHGKCAIRCVLEQTDILITSEFTFMKKLLNDPDERKKFNVSNGVLQDLWDILWIEVQDVRKKYNDLEMDIRNNWGEATGPKEQTPSKQHEKTAASLEPSLQKDTPLAPSKIGNNPFRGLFESPIRVYSETDDSEDEFFDALSS
ncbi:hypothetical protein CBL_13767 [Carabus blaptoides fortunei]